jgi:hypothetical protein
VTATVNARTTTPDRDGRTAAPRPQWVPGTGRLDVVPAGRWWDALVVPFPLGAHMVELLLAEPGGEPLGPVIGELWGPVPRVYFLIPAGSADRWELPGVEALGSGCFIGVPGMSARCGPGPHWLIPPDPSHAERLTAPAVLLRTLLGDAR